MSPHSLRSTALLAGAALFASGAVPAAPAQAAVPTPAWSIHPVALPSNFQPTDIQNNQGPYSQDHYTLVLSNVGSRDSSGPVTITDTLPPGVTTTQTPFSEEGNFSCTPEGEGNSVVTCTSTTAIPALSNADIINVFVAVAPGTSGTLTNQVQVSGGGAASADASVQTPVSSQVLPFGLYGFASFALDGSGVLDTQAGDHPGGLSTTFEAPTQRRLNGNNSMGISSVEEIRQVVVDLPPGLVGDPQAAPACSLTDFTSIEHGSGGCAAATQIGTLAKIGEGNVNDRLRVYNIQPEPGYPAEFGLYLPSLQKGTLLYGSVVGSGANTHVRVTSQPLPEAVEVQGVATTFFGDPAVRDGSPLSPVAFFSNPTDCSASGFTTTLHVDTWQHPGHVNADGTPDFSDPNWRSASYVMPPVTGCEALHFDPSLGVLPETTQAGSPSGYTFDLGIPQDENPNGLATPELKDVSVALPAGVSVSPSAADGLQACSDAQFQASSNTPSSCPLASQVGTVQITTPLLPNPLVGQVFVGSPDCGPCSTMDAQNGSLLRLFLQAQGSGVVIKVVGPVMVDPGTGQLTAMFENNPQSPFSDLRLQLKGGPRAPLANPTSCGTFTTTSDLVPWSTPFTPDGTPSSSFETTGCGNPNQFSPAFTAGTTSNEAGSFSPFNVSFTRSDQDQELGRVSVTTPPGLLAILKGIERCPEPQASQGTCGPGSLIGHTTASAGPGSHPFYVQGGQVYLTGPYKGAPYGLSIVVPAVAGPFNLGNVIVRAAVGVDPHTAQITVTSDPLPTMTDGIPLQIKAVNVSIDRQQFMFNPTSCEPMSVDGTLTSTQGASAGVSSRFQAAGCTSLPFKPVFTVSTQANTSKHNGASLTVKGAFPAGEANIHSVAVTLPKQLPARLTTIQQACTQAVFDLNPAACPVGSDIGTATASTPILAGSVSGPVYLVSHGGAAFPDVVAVLQGEGVTVDLTGSIDIKHGITSSTFATVPDAPITSFQLTLPEGPHSGLAAVVPARAKGSLCGQTLSMPFTITGQNGAQLEQNVKIAVTGCRKAKTVKHRRARSKKKGK